MPTNGKLYQFMNCNILSDHKIIREDIWVRNGKIVDPEKIFFDEKISADVKIDCANKLIVPGFIEIQINGGYGYDFSFEDKTEEGLAIVSKKLLEHGVTAFCPTVVTSPVDIYRKVLPKVARRKGGPHGATILGAHVEGPFINTGKKGAHPSACILSYDQGITQLEETYGSLDNIRIVTLAPELLNSSSVIGALRQRNIVVSLGKNEPAFISNDRFLCKYHLFLNVFRYILRSGQCWGRCRADGIHTHPAALRIAYRVHPDVTDAISALGLQAGQHKIGQLDIEVKDNKAFIAGTSTLCGSVASMIQCVRNFIKSTGCSPEYAFEAASFHPALALGIEKNKGSLSYGADADFIMLTDDYDISSTWIDGECVYSEGGM
ncbi:hypothetical protein HUJ05_001502 [Dendroctonus ponderosae]|nr:hypothetical protein HUJ05_001502 [Dendroctonus ponderosae]KAH1028106.1 hypothetical protein HUJ05_001502 [Dendroctonus ponderosae]